MSKKLTLSVVVFMAVLTLSACGKNPAPSQTNQSAVNSTPRNESQEKLPEPTGDEDGIVNGALNEASVEANEFAEEEAAAQSAIDDAEETDDFSQSYDENEF